MENKKQTAVEWFFDNLKNHEIQAEHYNLYQQALAMEKEQMKEGYNQGYRDGESDTVDINFVNMDVSMFANAENYYDETYGKD